jgi:hypothetical protein
MTTTMTNTMTDATIDIDTKMDATTNKVIFWHRELPPLNAEPIGEYVVEATSMGVPGTLAHRDELWDQCYSSLTKNVTKRVEQEIRRLGGDYAHVLNESVNSRHNDIAGVAWLHGIFTYMAYRRPPNS